MVGYVSQDSVTKKLIKERVSTD